MWAQATKADTSIVVVQSGNYEFVGVRHRQSQTLYISDIIEPHACKEASYGKIHVGIYVAAALDAIDRAMQRASGNRGPNGPSNGSSADHEGDKKPRGGGNKKSDVSKKKRKRSSNLQEGGGTGMMVMAVHEIAAKVCSI